MGRPSVRPAEGHVSVDYAPDGQSAERIVTSANDLGPDDSITLKLRLSPAGFTSTLPIWQREALERSRRGPWLLAVAAAVLVLGLSWLASFSSAWRRSDDPRAREVGTRGRAATAAAAGGNCDAARRRVRRWTAVRRNHGRPREPWRDRHR